MPLPFHFSKYFETCGEEPKLRLLALAMHFTLKNTTEIWSERYGQAVSPDTLSKWVKVFKAEFPGKSQSFDRQELESLKVVASKSDDRMSLEEVISALFEWHCQKKNSSWALIARSMRQRFKKDLSVQTLSSFVLRFLYDRNSRSYFTLQNRGKVWTFSENRLLSLIQNIRTTDGHSDLSPWTQERLHLIFDEERHMSEKTRKKRRSEMSINVAQGGVDVQKVKIVTEDKLGTDKGNALTEDNLGTHNRLCKQHKTISGILKIPCRAGENGKIMAERRLAIEPVLIKALANYDRIDPLESKQEPGFVNNDETTALHASSDAGTEIRYNDVPEGEPEPANTRFEAISSPVDNPAEMIFVDAGRLVQRQGSLKPNSQHIVALERMLAAREMDSVANSCKVTKPEVIALTTEVHTTDLARFGGESFTRRNVPLKPGGVHSPDSGVADLALAADALISQPSISDEGEVQTLADFAKILEMVEKKLHNPGGYFAPFPSEHEVNLAGLFEVLLGRMRQAARHRFLQTFVLETPFKKDQEEIDQHVRKTSTLKPFNLAISTASDAARARLKARLGLQLCTLFDYTNLPFRDVLARCSLAHATGTYNWMDSDGLPFQNKPDRARIIGCIMLDAAIPYPTPEPLFAEAFLVATAKGHSSYPFGQPRASARVKSLMVDAQLLGRDILSSSHPLSPSFHGFWYNPSDALGNEIEPMKSTFVK